MHPQHKHGQLNGIPVAICAEQQIAMKQSLDHYLSDRGATSSRSAVAHSTVSADEDAPKAANAPHSSAQAGLAALPARVCEKAAAPAAM